jgi:hypothetical protein
MGDSTPAEIVPSDYRGAERWWIPVTPRVSRYERPSIEGIPQLAATLGSSGAVQNSIRLPARESQAVREPGGSISSKSKFRG